VRVENLILARQVASKGRIPHDPGTPGDLGARWRRLRTGLSSAPAPWEAKGPFLGEMDVTIRSLAANILKYGGVASVVARFGHIQGHLGSSLRSEIEGLLLALHDQYVVGRNWELRRGMGEALGRARPIEGRGVAGCRQCGACCAGDARGPISTSPADIRLWESLGRDDLLYYTLPGSATAPARAASLDFLACPFLRFAESRQGVCLVHPVKPLICREFGCEAPSSG
jgi:hypothetical protein